MIVNQISAGLAAGLVYPSDSFGVGGVAPHQRQHHLFAEHRVKGMRLRA
jgi:hypothetical protein